MGIIVNKSEKLRWLERENRRLQAMLEQAQADIAFVSVMTDVDLPDMGKEIGEEGKDNE